MTDDQYQPHKARVPRLHRRERAHVDLRDVVRPARPVGRCDASGQSLRRSPAPGWPEAIVASPMKSRRRPYVQRDVRSRERPIARSTSRLVAGRDGRRGQRLEDRGSHGIEKSGGTPPCPEIEDVDDRRGSTCTICFGRRDHHGFGVEGVAGPVRASALRSDWHRRRGRRCRRSTHRAAGRRAASPNPGARSSLSPDRTGWQRH